MDSAITPIVSLTSATPVTCEGCIAGGVFDPSTTGPTGTKAARYIVFTAYAITSYFSSDQGNACYTENGGPFSVTSPFTEIVPASVSFLAYLPTANQRFVDYLGFSNCSVDVEKFASTSLGSISPGGAISSLPLASVSATVPSATATTTIPSSTIGSFATSTTFHLSTAGASTANAVSTSSSPTVVASSNGLNTGARISVDVIVPITCIALAAAAAFMLIRYRNKKRQAILDEKSGDNGTKMTNQSSPYLQYKGELEDEERRKHELEVNGVQNEMGEEGAIHEAPSGGGLFGNSRSQELHGFFQGAQYHQRAE